MVILGGWIFLISTLAVIFSQRKVFRPHQVGAPSTAEFIRLLSIVLKGSPFVVTAALQSDSAAGDSDSAKGDGGGRRLEWAVRESPKKDMPPSGILPKGDVPREIFCWSESTLSSR